MTLSPEDASRCLDLVRIESARHDYAARRMKESSLGHELARDAAALARLAAVLEELVGEDETDFADG